jgi:hypothetical protein
VDRVAQPGDHALDRRDDPGSEGAEGRLAHAEDVGVAGDGGEHVLAVEVDVREPGGPVAVRAAELAAGQNGDTCLFEQALAQVLAAADAAGAQAVGEVGEVGEQVEAALGAVAADAGGDQDVADPGAEGLEDRARAGRGTPRSRGRN